MDTQERNTDIYNPSGTEPRVIDPRASSAAKAAAEAASRANMTPNERRLGDLRRYSPDNPLYKADHPDHGKALTELRRLLASERTAEEQAVIDDMPIDQLRDMHGVELPKLIPALEQQWSTDLEADFLLWCDREGLDKSVVNDAYSWYARRAASNLADFTDEDADEFAEKFKGRFTRQQIAGLLRWHRTEVQPRRSR